MIMPSDPYRAPEIPPDVPVSDLPETDPLHVEPTGKLAALWVPVAIALAFAAGLIYLHYHHPNAAPSVHTSAALHSTPNLT
jgi:hypothetical protein